MQEIINQIIEGCLAVLKAPLDAIEAWLAAWLPGESIAALAAYAVYFLIIVFGGLLSIASRNLVRAMMGLILTFLGVAGMYLLLASPFLAFMQLLVYIGAVGVLVFFAIMLTKNTSLGDEAKLPKVSNGLYGFLAFLAPVAVLGPMIVFHAPALGARTYTATSAGDLGRGLITTDLAAFELISIILLVAMAGAVFLAWPGPGNRRVDL
jgi:NADH-quinone oxidoreductase subunit J